jgi:hypothetical protein
VLIAASKYCDTGKLLLETAYRNPIFPLDQASAVVVFDAGGGSFIDLKETTPFVPGKEYSPELEAVVAWQKRNRFLLTVMPKAGLEPRNGSQQVHIQSITYRQFRKKVTTKVTRISANKPSWINPLRR